MTIPVPPGNFSKLWGGIAPDIMSATDCYTGSMMDELTFRRRADQAIESLKKSLIEAEEDGDFEVEEQSGALNIVFEEPPAKFVITPNAPVRQIWISALATSFKLDWAEDAGDFVFAKDSLTLKPLVARLINQHLGRQHSGAGSVTLA